MQKHYSGRDLGEEQGHPPWGAVPKRCSSNHVLSLGQISRISVSLVLVGESRDEEEMPTHPLCTLIRSFNGPSRMGMGRFPQNQRGVIKQRGRGAGLVQTTAVQHTHFVKGKKSVSVCNSVLRTSFPTLTLGVQILTIFSERL